MTVSFEERSEVVLPSYWYETKCRRCNSISGHFINGYSGFTYRDFYAMMQRKIQEHCVLYCYHCLRETVQELVSFSQPQ